MNTFLWIIFYYTLGVVVLCSWSWKCYKRDGKFLWKGLLRDIAAVWFAGVCGILGMFFDAVIESVKGIFKGSRWLARKFKED